MEALKDKVFVPKKTITVQLPMDTIEKFRELCEANKLPKTKMIETLIVKEWWRLYDEGTEN